MLPTLLGSSHPAAFPGFLVHVQRFLLLLWSQGTHVQPDSENYSSLLRKNSTECNMQDLITSKGSKRKKCINLLLLTQTWCDEVSLVIIIICMYDICIICAIIIALMVKTKTGKFGWELKFGSLAVCLQDHQIKNAPIFLTHNTRQCHFELQIRTCISLLQW